MRLTRFFHSARGFTTAEVMVAMAASTIVMGGLVVAMTSLSRTFNATEVYSRAQTAQGRVIDAIAVDLRRATAVSITTAPGSDPAATSNRNTKFIYGTGNNTHVIQDGTYDAVLNRVGGRNAPSTYLTISMPAFYRSNDPKDESYRQARTIISTGSVVRYGTSSGVSDDIVVQYRKAYVPQFGTECFIRREAGVDRVIVEKAEGIDVDITAQPGNSFVVDAWFAPEFSRTREKSPARVTSSDRVMLRNPRRD